MLKGRGENTGTNLNLFMSCYHCLPMHADPSGTLSRYTARKTPAAQVHVQTAIQQEEEEGLI